MHPGLDNVTAVAIILAAILLAFDRVGLLERLGLRRPSAADAAAEIAIASETIKRLRAERNRERERVVQLEQTRSLEPVLEQLHQNAELQAHVLERLVHHNGSFKHIEEALGLVVEGMRTLTGTIAELHDIPLKPPERRRTTPRERSQP